MNKMIRVFGLLLISAVLFSACEKDDKKEKNQLNEEIVGCYIFNYGSFEKEVGSVSRYNYISDSTTVDYFKNQNNISLASNVQYAGLYNDHIYIMGNSADAIITLDKNFKPTKNAAKEGISKPRYFVGDGKYLYISSYGETPDWDVMADTKVFKFNTETNSVEETIELPGGPEGLALINNKLYVALNYTPQIAVVDLANDNAVSYIETPAPTSYFIEDKSGNLYVTLIDTYNHPSDEAGLGYINTTDDTLEEIYPLDGISASYSSIAVPNNNFTEIYVVAAGYNENWELTGALHTFDVETKEYSLLIDDLNGVNGVTVNPINDDIYVMLTNGSSAAGTVKIYNKEGTFVQDITTGISPVWAIFLN